MEKRMTILANGIQVERERARQLSHQRILFFFYGEAEVGIESGMIP